jgi:hypothetical protein
MTVKPQADCHVRFFKSASISGDVPFCFKIFIEAVVPSRKQEIENTSW